MEAHPRHCPSHASRRSAGFSLIELLVVIAIIGLLATIALPSYREHVRRGALEDATASIATGRVAIEQYFLDNRTYTDADAFCPAATEYFSMACDFDDTTYSITATGVELMDGFELTLDETGARAMTGPWGDHNCWIVRKGDTC